MIGLASFRLSQSLDWHLHYNFYPPYTSALIPICIEAIKQCSMGNCDAEIFGLTRVVTAGELVERLRLEEYVDAYVEVKSLNNEE